MNETNLKSSKNFGPLFIAAAASIWTFDAFVRVNLEDFLIANQLVMLEHLVIIAFITPFAYKYLPRLRFFDRKQWGSLLFIGIGGSAMATIALTIGFFMGDYPFQYVAVVVLLQQSQPIFAIGLAHFILKERLKRYYYILGIIALLGVFLIILPMPNEDSCSMYDVSSSITICDSDEPFSGISKFVTEFKTNEGVKASIFGLFAAILWGSSAVFGRYLLEHGKEKLDYFQMTTYRFFIAFVFLLSLTAFVEISSGIFDKDVKMMNYKFVGFPELSNLKEIHVISSLLFLSLIVGLLSLILYYYGLRTTHASMSAIFELAFPLSFFILIPVVKSIKPKLDIFGVVLYDLGSFHLNLHLLQIIGGILLIAATTVLSYIYAKSLDKNDEKLSTELT